jgi:hypothetical protein
MKSSNEISEIMLGHHALINLLFLAFKDALAKNAESVDEKNKSAEIDSSFRF